MTVTSLWTALDKAGCGTPVGVDDFNLRGRGDQPNDQTILAVDLSIWVCEGLASTALSSFHSDPALHLVYQRTTKLLRLGLGLVFVVEGQRRVRSQTMASSTQTHELKQRRSGSKFWNASKRCESLLQCLGVPVVRAEAEGESLCALLNSRGLVDGVISNDGDCLLFGAKTMYTGFTAEALESRQVMRYDADRLVAKLDESSSRTIKLSREDLVAFGMLTGSDLIGSGVNHVGHRKAIQFMHACRSLKHPCNDRTCLDELLSWSDESTNAGEPNAGYIDCDDDGPSTISSRCCSLCLHPGDKLQHEKHGCAQCGTEPGQGCYVVTSSEKFLRSLKEKAAGWIAPRHIVEGYFCPNSNCVPDSLSWLKTKPYSVTIDTAKLFTMESLVLKGRSKQTSHEYIVQTLPRLMARLDLWDTGPRNRYATTKIKYKPIPVRIEKSVVKQSWPCYEIAWSINIPPSEVQFSTVECQTLVNTSFPQLVKSFHQEERRRQQGRAEDERRKHFVGAHRNAERNQSHQSQRRDLSKPAARCGNRRKRERNFDAGRVSRKVQKTLAGQAPSNEVSMLLDSLQPDEHNIEESEAIEKSDGQEPEQDIVELDATADATANATANATGWTSKFNAEEEYWYSQNALSQHREDDNMTKNGEEPVGDVGVGHDEHYLHSNDIFQEGILNNTCGDRDLLGDLAYGEEWYQQEEHIHPGDSTSETKKQLFCQDEGVGYYAESSSCYTDQPIEQRGKSEQNSLAQHLSPSTQLFCDMGGIQIAVTPLISRRWRYF